ncbi:MAG: orotidine-5'-phosphate decarboxylase [Phycisphaerae bacterium]
MKPHFADTLLKSVEQVGSPVCVGIDPRLDRVPAQIRSSCKDPLDALRTFCMGLLDAVVGIVPAVKPQIAYFEVYRHEGIQLYFDVVARARQVGLVVIGDAKRGDIGSTAEAYAAGHLSGESDVDALTVNGYFGADGLQPFVSQARQTGRGLFVLVRTSNPSAQTIQDFQDASGKTFYTHIAQQVADLGSQPELVGSRGYSCVGAVVGATWPKEARQLREVMDRQIFLVPGYGAQGATAEDCAASFKDDGTGAIVNASRSVIYAHQRKEFADLDWKQAVARAAEQFAQDIARAVLPD